MHRPVCQTRDWMGNRNILIDEVSSAFGNQREGSLFFCGAKCRACPRPLRRSHGGAAGFGGSADANGFAEVPFLMLRVLPPRL
jgi:hypothetical protein